MGTIYRVTFISRIKANWLRRLAMLIAFPLLLALNVLTTLLSLIPFLLIAWHRNNRELFRSFPERWKEPSPQTPAPPSSTADQATQPN